MLTSASFLRAHRAAVGEVADLAQDLGDRPVAAARLALLDEVRVLGHARGVEDDPDPVRVAQRAHLAQVRQADRLPARHVHGRRDADVRDPLRAVLGDHALELGEVDVALERMLARRVVGLVDDHVDERAAGELLVQPRRREVHVPRDDVAGLDQDLRQDVLGARAPGASARGAR